MSKLKFIHLVSRPSWIVGLAGSGIFLSMLMNFDFFKQADQFMLGMLFGIVMTCIGFWMSINGGGK